MAVSGEVCSRGRLTRKCGIASSRPETGPQCPDLDESWCFRLEFQILSNSGRLRPKQGQACMADSGPMFSASGPSLVDSRRDFVDICAWCNHDTKASARAHPSAARLRGAISCNRCRMWAKLVDPRPSLFEVVQNKHLGRDRPFSKQVRTCLGDLDWNEPELGKFRPAPLCATGLGSSGLGGPNPFPRQSS